MIPQRFRLSGFLSYKDEQTIPFDAAPLWMLAGSNGSGKSAVFDALTYALFGYHRGGSQNAAELINKDSTGLAIEFDFKLDGQIYRIKRTLRRSPKGSVAGTQQIFQLLPGGGWDPLPDTGKKADFDKWIHDHVGLNYETFTSSVLLLQGKAEKLLDSKPSGRAEVLAGIVDLERYQRLHERANTRKLELRSRLEALTHQTAAVPDVSDEEYTNALLAIEEADKARKDAQAEIDALREIETQCQRWIDAKARLSAAEAKLRSAQHVLADAVRIEARHSRLVELRDVLPAVNTVVTKRIEMRDSQAKTDRLERLRVEGVDRKTAAEHALEQAKQKRANLQKTLAADEGKLSTANTRLRELSATLEKIRLADEQQTDFDRLSQELAQLPKDPESLVRKAQEEVDRLTELNRVLPILERFQMDRHELADAVKTEQSAKKELERIQARGEKLKAELATAEPLAARAKEERARADEQVAVTKTLAEQAAAALAEFATLAGAKSCRACGQPLTKKHFAEEKAKREEASTAADAAYTAAVTARRTAEERDREHAARVAELTAEIGKLRESYAERRSHHKQAGTDVKRLADALALQYAQVPEPYRSRIAESEPEDWTTTKFPERDELVVLRREVGTLEKAKRDHHDAQSVDARWGQLRARLDSAKQTLARLRAGLPADTTPLRSEQHTLQAEEKTLTASIRAAKIEIASAESETDKLGREAHVAAQQVADSLAKLHTEEQNRKHIRDAIDRAKANLPEPWAKAVDTAGLAEHSTWRGEYDELLVDQTEAKFQQLAIARGGLTSMRQEILAAETEVNAFPESARRSPEEVKQLLANARQSFDDRDAALQEARRKKDELDGFRTQRAKLGDQFKKSDAEHNRYKILAELLGRDRLQRHLVRQAERQIVDYANAVLDRLSDGQLFLKLVATEDGSERALDLECSNRVTGGAPINVAFLSGSQRFRVAVSLALGIGQYASKQHRPIESVIIDEGFGCLDRQGRQVMIQELQNLRGHLRCILLVSHQEEFAEAFADGYRFELCEGATRVSRFQK